MILFSSVSYAQKGIKVTARPYQDSTVIRWAPTNHLTWREGIRDGYDIYRFTISRNDSVERGGDQYRLNKEVIKPQSQSYWEQKIDSSKWAELYAITLYGEFEMPVEPKGSFNSFSNAYKTEQGRYAYNMLASEMSLDVAKAAGLCFVDKYARENETYFYQVFLHEEDSTYSSKYEGAKLVGYNYSNDYYLDSIRDFNANNFEHQVLLTWSNQVERGPNYSNYIVLRSETKTGGYERINRLPVFNTTDQEFLDTTLIYFTDSLPELNNRYYYKVAGRNLFGDWSPITEPVMVEGKDLLQNKEFGLKLKRVDNKEVVLTWEENAEQDLVTGYDILRSDEYFGKYERLVNRELSKKTRSFTDKNPLKNSYYILVTHTEAEVVSSVPQYMHIIDDVPPLTPEGLEAKVDSNGVLTLSWLPNSDLDLFGYRVYKSNTVKQEFSRETEGSILDTFYVDTINLKTLTKSVYYKVVAIDDSYNPSPLSPYLEVKRPDIIPPTSPLISDISSSEKGVYIEWQNSSSEDLAKQYLYREDKKGDLTVLLQLEGEGLKQRSFIDSTATPRKDYYFYLVAEDDSELRSPPSNKILFAKVPVMVKKALTGFEATLNRKSQLTKLEWNPASRAEAYVVFRKVNNNKLIPYKRIPGMKPEFYDKMTKINSSYTYQVQAVFKDGSSTRLTEPITIKY